WGARGLLRPSLLGGPRRRSPEPRPVVDADRVLGAVPGPSGALRGGRAWRWGDVLRGHHLPFALPHSGAGGAQRYLPQAFRRRESPRAARRVGRCSPGAASVPQAAGGDTPPRSAVFRRAARTRRDRDGERG